MKLSHLLTLGWWKRVGSKFEVVGIFLNLLPWLNHGTAEPAHSLSSIIPQDVMTSPSPELCLGDSKKGWYVLRPSSSYLYTPFLARPCAEIRLSLRLAFSPPASHHYLTVELVKDDVVFITHKEPLPLSTRPVELRLKGLPLLRLSGPGDYYTLYVDYPGVILSASLSARPAKSKMNKMRVVTRSPIRPPCEFARWERFGFEYLSSEPQQKTLSVLDLAAAGRLFAVKNASSSNVLEWHPAAPSRLVSDLGCLVTRAPHYRREQLWRAVTEECCPEGVWRGLLVSAATPSLQLEMRLVGDSFYSIGMPDSQGVLDECIPEGSAEGCRGVKLSFEVEPPIKKQLWLLELPHQNLLAFVHGVGLRGGGGSTELSTTPAGRVLGDPFLLHQLALF